MPSIAEILEFSTDRLTSSEVSRKRAILLLRWTLFGCLLGLGTAGAEDFFHLLPIGVSLCLFVTVNLALSFLPLHAFRAPTFEFSLSLFDTALISYVIFEADPTGYLCLFFFLLLVSTAASNRMSQFLLASTIMSVLYILVHGIQAPRTDLFSVFQLMVLPFFFTTSVYFGFQVLQIRDRRAQLDKVHRERKELQIVLGILESITSSLDFHGVMFQIASRIAEVVDAVRCSILLVEGERDEKAFVVASNDDRRLKMLPVDLAKYPEVQMAIRQRKAVVIEDIEKSDLLKPFLEELRKLHFHSLLILPILYQEAVIGTLFLRAARKRSFSQDELKFCRVVASAAASAIKNLKDSGLTEFKLKAGVMVQKDDRGNVSLIEDRNRPLVGTAVGTAAGALIGLLGGAPGVAVGAAIGATTGLSGDAVMAALDSDFVDSVTDGMRPGMTAIIVEADEGSTRAVDDIVALGNGTVYRQAA